MNMGKFSSVQCVQSAQCLQDVAEHFYELFTHPAGP